MQHKYFAASNSAQGFKNYYPEVFARADILYVIKGGPGTGKSSFMKKYAKRAENLGFEVEYYYCSSDPTSLDGVLIFGNERVTGILDGTPPHVCEPILPGAREEIVNLGEFWDSDLLRRQKNEIRALCERKSSEYKSAYTFLRSVGNLRAVKNGLINDALLNDKMRSVAEKLANDYPHGNMKALTALTDSISMCGRVRFDTFEKNARTVYYVTDFYGVGGIFLGELLDSLKKRDVKARVSYDPISPEQVDGIFIEDNKTAFVIVNANIDPDEIYKKQSQKVNVRFNSKRFVDTDRLKSVRSELRYTSKLVQSSLDGALHSLSKARIYHFLLEDIYGKAMDFRRLGDIDIELI